MKARIEFEVDIPSSAATEEEIIAWLRYGFRDNGSLPMMNPLVDIEPEPIFGTFCVDLI